MLWHGRLTEVLYNKSKRHDHQPFFFPPISLGKRDPKDCAGVILLAAERATWMASQAIQCLGTFFLLCLSSSLRSTDTRSSHVCSLSPGGNGYINEYPTGRIWRDAKLYEIGAGTSEIRRMLIGRELNKMYTKV